MAGTAGSRTATIVVPDEHSFLVLVVLLLMHTLGLATGSGTSFTNTSKFRPQTGLAIVPYARLTTHRCQFPHGVAGDFEFSISTATRSNDPTERSERELMHRDMHIFYSRKDH